MMIFKKVIPRRTLLKGASATLALPFLDAMVPALVGAAKPAIRMGFMYAPNGILMEKWTPATEGVGFQITPTLEALAPYRDRVLVLSGLDQNEAGYRPGERDGPHSQTAAAYLTGVRPKPTEGADIQNGVSVDQIAARELGKNTQIASLEMSLAPTEAAGKCESGYACVYRNTLVWSTPTNPLPMVNQPRAVFERLFGDNETTDPATRLARIQENRSLLDSLSENVGRLVAGLDTGDRRKLTEYLDAIRDIERRIQIAEQQTSQELPTLERPVGIPASFEEYSRLMYDLLLIAYQADLTRIFTFMIGSEQNSRTYPEIGVPDPHHPLSHHRGDPVVMAKVAKINAFHVKLFSYFVEKLRSTPDGDGSLLDHCLIVYGSGMSDGNMHVPLNLPVLLVGGGTGKVKSGRHLRYPTGTPMTNLYLSMLDMVGVPVDKLGDSTGKLELLSFA